MKDHGTTAKAWNLKHPSLSRHKETNCVVTCSNFPNCYQYCGRPKSFVLQIFLSITVANLSWYFLICFHCSLHVCQKSTPPLSVYNYTDKEYKSQLLQATNIILNIRQKKEDNHGIRIMAETFSYFREIPAKTETYLWSFGTIITNLAWKYNLF